MNKKRMVFDCYHVPIFICALFLGCSKNEKKQVEQVEQIEHGDRTYSTQQTPNDKLYATIQLMSNGTIQRGTKLEYLKEIFHDDLVWLKKSQSNQDLWIVGFSPIPKMHKPDYASAFTGWYLKLEIDKHNKVVEYHLSNANK